MVFSTIETRLMPLILTVALRELVVFICFIVLLTINTHEQTRKLTHNYPKLLLFHICLFFGVFYNFLLSDNLIPVFHLLIYLTCVALIKASGSVLFAFFYLFELLKIPQKDDSDLTLPFLVVRPVARLITRETKEVYIKTEEVHPDMRIIRSYCNYVKVGETRQSSSEVNTFLGQFYDIFGNDDLQFLKTKWTSLSTQKFSEHFNAKILDKKLYFCVQLCNFLKINNQTIRGLFKTDTVLLKSHYESNTSRYSSLRHKYLIEDLWQCYPFLSVSIECANLKIIEMDLTNNVVIDFKGRRLSHACLKPANQVVNEILIFEIKNEFASFSKNVSQLEISLNIMINELFYKYKLHRFVWNLPAGWDQRGDVLQSIFLARSDQQSYSYLTMDNKVKIHKRTKFINGLEKQDLLVRDFWDFEILLNAFKRRINEMTYPPKMVLPIFDIYFRIEVRQIIDFLNSLCQKTEFLEVIEVRLFLLLVNLTDFIPVLLGSPKWSNFLDFKTGF